MASGEQFFDQSGMDRNSAFAFSGGAQDVDSPDAEASGDQGSRVHPWTPPLPVGQKVGPSRGDFHPQCEDGDMSGC